MCGSATTHSEAVLSALPGLVSINSALEVDLTGQVNAEAAGGAYERHEVIDLIRRLEDVDAKVGGQGAMSLPAAIAGALRDIS